MKITKKKKQRIKELREEGKTYKEIAKQLKISQRAVSYWLLSEDKRKEAIKKICENFKKKSLKEKRKIYKRRLEYIKQYQRDRYHDDKEFRKKKLELVRNYYHKKKVTTKN